MNQIVKKTEYLHAVEIHALRPGMTIKEIADECGVSEMTIASWRRNPAFVDLVYERYMVEFGSELPAVLKAMVREAKSGNVQAGRLVLEHSGKLVKNINITVDSPFEKFLKAVPDAEVIEDAQIVEAAEVVESEFESLPPRDEQDQNVRIRNENLLNRKAIQKEERKLKYNQKQKEWYKWRTRGKKVGIEPLKGRRPTPAQRKDWQNSIIEAELANSK